MEHYEKTFRILSSDTDTFRRLRLSSLFTMLQEAAIAHTTSLGMGREKTLDKGLLWIITHQALEISRLPVYDETVTLVSWPGKTMHLFFPRFFRMTDVSGETLLTASMLWGLMDREARHIVSPEEYGVVINEDRQMPALPFPKAPAVREAEESDPFNVPYSYLDLNGHMNNTRYYDLAEDRMPSGLRRGDLMKISAQFSAEVPPETTLTLKTAGTDSSFYMEGLLPDGRSSFRMELAYRPS